MSFHFINSPQKKKIVEKLNDQFGITSIPHLLLQTGKEKIRAFSGHMSKDELMELTRLARVEIIGLYVLREEHDMRLSLDGALLYKDQITKNKFELTKEQMEAWMRGEELLIKHQPGTYIMTYQGKILGCGRSTGDKIANYIPKDRRVRQKTSMKSK